MGVQAFDEVRLVQHIVLHDVTRCTIPLYLVIGWSSCHASDLSRRSDERAGRVNTLFVLRQTRQQIQAAQQRRKKLAIS
jgi:hypothetical protein